jgi:nucleoside-diphosphate-sugar epimerase
VHVSDVVEATLLALSDENDSPQIFNVGTGIGYSTNEIAEKVVRLSGRAVNPIHKNTKHAPNQIVCDITRAETVLGYRPTVPIDEGITEEINFLSKNPEFWRMP